MKVIENFRFQLPIASEEDWNNANPRILKGEKILVQMIDGSIREKIGDGTTSYANLPFFETNFKTYTGILASDNWQDDGNYSRQEIPIIGLLADYAINPDVDCILTGNDAEGDAAVLEGWQNVHICETKENSLVATCINGAPTVNIPIIIRIFD